MLASGFAPDGRLRGIVLLHICTVLFLVDLTKWQGLKVGVRAERAGVRRQSLIKHINVQRIHLFR